MPVYTYAPAPVLIEVTGDFAIGVSGVLRDPTSNNAVSVFDLNGSPIASIMVGPKGAHQGFKADIPYGTLDFGSVLLPSSSLEQQSAGLTAIQTANAAASSASAAATSAATAAATAQSVLSQLADLTSTGEVSTLITSAMTANLNTLMTPIVVAYNFTTNSWSSQVRPATTRRVFWLHPAAQRPALTGTTAGGTLAAVKGLDWLFEVGP